jgi:hypothetical protein
MVLINVVRVNHKLANYGNAQIEYNKLKKINHELAAKYSYLQLKGDASLKAYEGDKVRLG